MKNKIIEFEVLSNGQIKFSRKNPKLSEDTCEILIDVGSDESIKDFFAVNEQIKLIVGDEIMCG